MFQDLWVKHRAWVLDPIAYGSVEELVQGLDEEIIQPALARFDEPSVRLPPSSTWRSNGNGDQAS